MSASFSFVQGPLMVPSGDTRYCHRALEVKEGVLNGSGRPTGRYSITFFDCREDWMDIVRRVPNYKGPMKDVDDSLEGSFRELADTIISSLTLSLL